MTYGKAVRSYLVAKRKKFQVFRFVSFTNLTRSVSMDITGVLNCLFVFVVLARCVRTSLISTKVDLCGPILELPLDQFNESSATIAFAAFDEYTPICKLKITAPETYVINMNIIETIPEELLRTSGSESCYLNVFQQGSPQPVWSGDPCSHQTLSDIDLLHPEVILEWTPPVDPSHTKGKKLVVTAVGRGDSCKDGQNCPRGATRNDVDDRVYKIKRLFEQFMQPEMNEMLSKTTKSPKIYPPISRDLFAPFMQSEINEMLLKTTKSPKIYSIWRDRFAPFMQSEMNEMLLKTTKSPKIGPIWPDGTYGIVEVTTLLPTTTTTVETQTTNIESLSAALSHYGPWGYILLGLLICGTVLIFWGVWIYFKKPKPPADATQAVPPGTNTANTATTTTTVLIIQEEDNSPPNYDDLKPPSYSTLFPNVKEDEPVLTDNGRFLVTQINGRNRQD